MRPLIMRFLLIVSFAILVTVSSQAQPATQASAAAAVSADSPTGKQEIEVLFKVSLEELAKRFPEKLMVYSLTPDPVGDTQREVLKKFFGRAAQVEVHKVSGGVFAADLSRLWAKGPKITEDIRPVDEKRLRSACEDFLGKIRGLPREETVVQISQDVFEITDRNGKRRSTPLGGNVTFRRLLEGYEVVGPGGKLKVFVDKDAKVAGYLRVWRRLKPHEAEPLIRVTQAAEEFKKAPLGGTLFADVVKVVVTDIKLAYLERGMSEPQEYLQPVYLFKCLAYVKGGERPVEVPYARYLEALAKPLEPLWLPGKGYPSGDRPKTPPKRGED